MPAAEQYRVVETTWKGPERVETDIGCEWKPQAKARDELRQKQLKQDGRLYSLQKRR